MSEFQLKCRKKRSANSPLIRQDEKCQSMSRPMSYHEKLQHHLYQCGKQQYCQRQIAKKQQAIHEMLHAQPASVVQKSVDHNTTHEVCNQRKRTQPLKKSTKTNQSSLASQFFRSPVRKQQCLSVPKEELCIDIAWAGSSSPRRVFDLKLIGMKSDSPKSQGQENEPYELRAGRFDEMLTQFRDKLHVQDAQTALKNFVDDGNDDWLNMLPSTNGAVEIEPDGIIIKQSLLGDNDWFDLNENKSSSLAMQDSGLQTNDELSGTTGTVSSRLNVDSIFKAPITPIKSRPYTLPISQIPIDLNDENSVCPNIFASPVKSQRDTLVNSLKLCSTPLMNRSAQALNMNEAKNAWKNTPVLSANQLLDQHNKSIVDVDLAALDTSFEEMSVDQFEDSFDLILAEIDEKVFSRNAQFDQKNDKKIKENKTINFNTSVSFQFDDDDLDLSLLDLNLNQETSPQPASSEKKVDSMQMSTDSIEWDVELDQLCSQI